MWKVFASVGSIWEDFNIFFLLTSPCILVLYKWWSSSWCFSVAHLKLTWLSYVLYLIKWKIGKKKMRSLIFEAWSCDAEAGKDTSGQRWRNRVQKPVQLQCIDPKTVDTDGTTCMGHIHLFPIAVNLPKYVFPMLRASPSIAASLAQFCIPSS